MVGSGVMVMAAAVSSMVAVAPVTDEGVEFSGQTLLFVILGALALIAVSMLGPISRIFDHRAERRREEREQAKKDAAAAGDPDPATTAES